MPRPPAPEPGTLSRHAGYNDDALPVRLYHFNPVMSMLLSGASPGSTEDVQRSSATAFPSDNVAGA